MRPEIFLGGGAWGDAECVSGKREFATRDKAPKHHLAVQLTRSCETLSDWIGTTMLSFPVVRIRLRLQCQVRWTYSGLESNGG